MSATGAGIVRYDVERRELDWSDEALRLLELDRERAPRRLDELPGLVHRDDRACLAAALCSRGRLGERRVVELRVSRPGGAYRLVAVDLDGGAVEGGAVEGGAVESAVPDGERAIYGVLRDVEHQRALEDSEARYRLVVAATDVGVWDLDVAGRRFFWDDRARELLGQPPGARPEVERVEAHVHPDDLEAARAAAHEALARPGHVAFEMRVTDAAGAVRQVQWMGRSEPDQQGVVRRVAGIVRDVTELRRVEQELRHQALHDPLTGLPNRTLLVDRLEQALARAARSGTDITVLLLDLDDFKAVNDSLGHDAGDELLRTLAPRLTAVVRANDTVARLGGDEFVVLAEQLTGPQSVELAARLRRASERPLELAGQTLQLTASVGIAHGGSGGRTPEEFIRDADAAMYRAKAGGRERIQRFDRAMRADAVEHMRTLSDLRAGLERGELRLRYQPIVALEGGGLRAVEALVRWQHPTRGLLAPAEFVPLAERTGLISAIGDFVLAQACRDAARWQRARPSEPPLVTINLSGRQLGDMALAETLERATAAATREGGTVGFEITESVLAGEADGEARRLLDTLRGAGARLLLDDFGTGCSSLASLRRYPLDALKVDRSFVAGLGADEEDSAIVEAVVAMARALELNVVAEGVERPEQVEALRELGCDMAQGYLFARPLPAADVDALLREGPRLPC